MIKTARTRIRTGPLQLVSNSAHCAQKYTWDMTAKSSRQAQDNKYPLEDGKQTMLNNIPDLALEAGVWVCYHTKVDFDLVNIFSMVE